MRILFLLISYLNSPQVVGADGHNSFVRSLVMDGEIEPEHIVSGQVSDLNLLSKC
jgi:hypothetical protein